MRDDLLRRLEDLKTDLDYLVRCLSRSNLDAVLKLIQYYQAELRSLGEPSSVSESEIARIKRSYTAFRPPVTMRKIAAWTCRAKRIAKEDNVARALSVFWSIDDPLAHLSEQVKDAVEQVEKHEWYEEDPGLRG